MNLMVLGMYGPYPAKFGATAGYLADTVGGKIVLDMGSGVFERLSRLAKPETISALVLSHLHHDHVADMGVYNYYLELLHKQGKFMDKIPCYLPAEEQEGVLGVEQMRALYPYFDFIPVEAGKKYRFGGVIATFYALQHGAANYGVRLYEEQTGRTLAYSGDTNVCPALDELVEGCHLWLGGAPYIGKEYDAKGGHLSVEVMQQIAEKHDVKALVTHLCPQHTVREYQSACKDKRMQVAASFHAYQV